MSRTIRRSNVLWMDYYQKCPDSIFETPKFQIQFESFSIEEIRKIMQKKFLSGKSPGKGNKYGRRLSKRKINMKNRLKLKQSISLNNDFTEVLFKRGY